MKLLYTVYNFGEGSIVWKGTDLCLVKSAEFMVLNMSSTCKLACVLDTSQPQVQLKIVQCDSRSVSSCHLDFIFCCALFQGVDGSCQSKTGWALASAGDGVTEWQMTSCQAGWIVGCPWVVGLLYSGLAPLGCTFMVLLCHTVLHA